MIWFTIDYGPSCCQFRISHRSNSPTNEATSTYTDSTSRSVGRATTSLLTTILQLQETSNTSLYAKWIWKIKLRIQVRFSIVFYACYCSRVVLNNAVYWIRLQNIIVDLFWLNIFISRPWQSISVRKYTWLTINDCNSKCELWSYFISVICLKWF